MYDYSVFQISPSFTAYELDTGMWLVRCGTPGRGDGSLSWSKPFSFPVYTVIIDTARLTGFHIRTQWLQIPLRIICNPIWLWLGDTCFCLNFLSEHWFIFLLVQFFIRTLVQWFFDLHKSSLRCPFSRSTWLFEVWKFCCFLAAYWEWGILSKAK